MKTLTIILLILIQPTASWGQENSRCGSYQDVSNVLRKEYGEAPVLIGLSSMGTVFQVFRSANGDTFSVIETNTQGITCIQVMGVGLESLIWHLGVDGSDL